LVSNRRCEVLWIVYAEKDWICKCRQLKRVEVVCRIDVIRVGRVLRNTEITVECQGYLSSPTKVIIVEVEESCMRLDDCINRLSAS
jgi:hypothetical protein